MFDLLQLYFMVVEGQDGLALMVTERSFGVSVFESRGRFYSEGLKHNKYIYWQ